MLDHERNEPLSPELVLVSPELRERMSSEERDVRSDPPEDAAPPVVPPPAVAPPPPAMPAVPIAPPATAMPPATADPVAPPPPTPPAGPPRMPAAPPLAPPSTQTTAARVEWRLTVGAATVLALCTLLVFGAGVAVGQLALPVSTTGSSAAPSSSPGRPPTTPAATPAPAAPQSNADTTARSESDRSHATPRSITAASSGTAVPQAPVPSGALPIPTGKPPATAAREPKSSPAPAETTTQPPNAVRPAPNSGYVFLDGNFQLSRDGRSIVRFTVRTSCAGPLVLGLIRVAPAGTFAFSGRPAGSLPGTDVRLTGRFASRAVVRGTLRVTRATCHDTATPFVAHLS